MPVILTLGALMQEDDKFKISLGYGVRPLVQTKQNNKPFPYMLLRSQGREAW